MWYVSHYPRLSSRDNTPQQAIINPAVVPLSKEFDIPPVTGTYQTTVAIGTSSLGPLLFTPFANVYGRRPAYLLSVLIGFVSAIGSASAKSYGGLIAARAINGFGPSAALGLGAGTVVDLFFEHQRGKAMGFFTLMLTNGAHLAPIVCVPYLSPRPLSSRSEFFIVHFLQGRRLCCKGPGVEMVLLGRRHSER